MSGKYRKRSRRGNREGGFTWRKDGRLQVTATVHLPDGSTKRIYHYAKTKREGKEWLDKVKLEEESKLAHSFDKTLITWLREWKRDFCINIRQSTADSYDLNIRRIENSSVANVLLEELNAQMLQSYILYLMEHGRMDGNGGLSAKSIKNLFSMLHQALKQAVGCGLLSSNPADYVQLPKVKSKPVEVLNQDEMKRLLEACSEERWYASMVILMWTGCRLAEMLGLRREHFKCQNGMYYLTIRQSLHRTSNPDYDPSAAEGIQSRKTILAVTECKTENAYRDLPLLPEVAEVLMEKFRQQDETAAEFPEIYTPNPFITDNGTGNCVDSSDFRRWFNAMVKRAGITKRTYPHLLRHGFGSIAVQNNVDQKHIADLLGHYSTEFSSRVYQHTCIDSRMAAMAKLQGLASDMLRNK